MANLHSAANTELQKLRGEVEKLTKAKALLKGALQEAEESKAALKESYEKMLVEGKQREDRQTAKLADVTSDWEQVAASKGRLEGDVAALQQQLAEAHARGKDLESKLHDTEKLLEREGRQLADERDKGAAAAASLEAADALQAELAAVRKAKVGLEEELAALRESLEGESGEKGKVAAERSRLQSEVAQTQEQCQALLATVNQWASWRSTLTQHVLQVKEAQRYACARARALARTHAHTHAHTHTQVQQVKEAQRCVGLFGMLACFAGWLDCLAWRKDAAPLPSGP